MALRNPFRRAPAQSLSPAKVQQLPMDMVVNMLTASDGSGYEPGRMLPRDPSWMNLFGPNVPFTPVGLDQPRPDGVVDPRYTEYPVTWNIDPTVSPRIAFHDLREASTKIDLVRRCIELRKKEIAARDWTFTVAPWAVNREAARSNKPKQDIEAQLAKEYAADIEKANAFWRFPGKNQDFIWEDWCYQALEQYLVIDAWVVYPQRTYGGELYSLDLIDGATIKPLRDVRGGKPQAPYPAFQQILYGFPRGEYLATTIDIDGKPAIPNAYRAGEMYYFTRGGDKVQSPFGMSPVEQALISAKLYLKRQGWMLAEYDDGVIPRAWIESQLTQGDYGEMTAQQRRMWQDALNAELAGDTVARQRLTVLAPGQKAVETGNVDERYKPDYDLFLIKLLAMHFDIPIGKLGFTEAKGLGDSGWHEASADNYERQATRPDTEWFSQQVSRISHEQLNIRPEVVHKFLGLDSQDEAAQDQVWENRVRSGRATLNEDRARNNLPLYQFPEADMAMLETTRGVVFLNGSSKLAPSGVMVEPAEYQPQQPGQPMQSGASGGAKPGGAGAKPKSQPATSSSQSSSTTQKAAEAVAFAKWAAKHPNPSRRFHFEHLTPADAPELADDPRCDWS